MSEKTTIKFKPKQVVKRLLSVVGDRSRDVLVSRFGLGTDTKRMTLEAIGKKYKITRERVRQIENYSIINIRKSKEYTKEKESFDELLKLITDLGGTISEEQLLKHISKDKATQNQIHFILVIGEEFTKEKEVGQIASGKQVEVLDRDEKNLFIKIYSQEISGWIQEKYSSPSASIQ
jgi:hypothetical protein